MTSLQFTPYGRSIGLGFKLFLGEEFESDGDDRYNCWGIEIQILNFEFALLHLKNANPK